MSKGKYEVPEDFQYYLNDRETVVNFDAPTEVLQEYLTECIESASKIRVRLKDMQLESSLNSEVQDADWRIRYNRLSKGLTIQLALKSRLISELKARKQGKVTHLESAIEGLKNAIKKMPGYDAASLNDELFTALQQTLKTVEEKDRLIQEQRSHLAGLNKIIEEFRDLDGKISSPQGKHIEDLKKGIAKRNAVIHELIELDDVSLREIRIAIQKFKESQQNRKESTSE